MAEEESKAKRYNLLISIFDKELRKMSEGLSQFLSQFGLLKTDIGERIWGVSKSWIEQIKKDKSPFSKAVLEKFTDLLDFTGANLFGKGKEGRSAVEKRARDWMDEFTKDAFDRIKKAKTEDGKRKVRALLEVEFKLRQEILAVIEAARPKEEKEEEEKKPLISDETKEQIRDIIHDVRDQHGEWMKKRIATLRERRMA